MFKKGKKPEYKSPISVDRNQYEQGYKDAKAIYEKALDKAITYIMNIKDKDCMIDKCFRCPLETKCDNARNVRAEWKEWLMKDE